MVASTMHYRCQTTPESLSSATIMMESKAKAKRAEARHRWRRDAHHAFGKRHPQVAPNTQRRPGETGSLPAQFRDFWRNSAKTITIKFPGRGNYLRDQNGRGRRKNYGYRDAGLPAPLAGTGAHQTSPEWENIAALGFRPEETGALVQFNANAGRSGTVTFTSGPGAGTPIKTSPGLGSVETVGGHFASASGGATGAMSRFTTRKVDHPEPTPCGFLPSGIFGGSTKGHRGLSRYCLGRASVTS